jgi:hypothetical protein
VEVLGPQPTVRKRNRRRKFRIAEIFSVMARANSVCALCGKKVEPSDATIDHIVPLHNGGTYDIDNLQLAHRSCNSSKGTGQWMRYQPHRLTASDVVGHHIAAMDRASKAFNGVFDRVADLYEARLAEKDERIREWQARAAELQARVEALEAQPEPRRPWWKWWG